MYLIFFVIIIIVLLFSTCFPPATNFFWHNFSEKNVFFFAKYFCSFLVRFCGEINEVFFKWHSLYTFIPTLPLPLFTLSVNKMIWHLTHFILCSLACVLVWLFCGRVWKKTSLGKLQASVSQKMLVVLLCWNSTNQKASLAANLTCSAH